MNTLNFRGLQERLRDDLRDRVQRGELTERGIARLTGVSQPHIHNFLKGQRFLSQPTADRILHHLRMNVLDLLNPQVAVVWKRRN